MNIDKLPIEFQKGEAEFPEKDVATSAKRTTFQRAVIYLRISYPWESARFRAKRHRDGWEMGKKGGGEHGKTS